MERIDTDVSHTWMGSGILTSKATRETDERVVDADGDGQAILAALDDDASRTILEATRKNVSTASELSETLDIPLSTTYRKLDTLVEAGLLEERTRVRESGKHSSEYACTVDEVSIGVREGRGFSLRISLQEGPHESVSE